MSRENRSRVPLPSCRVVPFSQQRASVILLSPGSASLLVNPSWVIPVDRVSLTAFSVLFSQCGAMCASGALVCCSRDLVSFIL